jgi:hypothetical protein
MRGESELEVLNLLNNGSIREEIGKETSFTQAFLGGNVLDAFCLKHNEKEYILQHRSLNIL